MSAVLEVVVESCRCGRDPSYWASCPKCGRIVVDPQPRTILDPDFQDRLWNRFERMVFLGTDGGNFDYYGDPDDKEFRVFYVGCAEGCSSGLFGPGWYFRNARTHASIGRCLTSAGLVWPSAVSL